ncbi:putative nuclease HARBI1 [Lineus longissimus]|uniref:putative nuclease HARBI1 n=1 Tax=Lineus longissimus TaxID=88925 RepID=UPI00315D0794
MGDFLQRIAALNRVRAVYQPGIDQRVVVRQPRGQYRDDIHELNDENFRKRYRFTKAGFNYVLNIIADEIPPAQNNRGHPIPPVIQLQVALRFYATGTFQIVCGDLNNVSQPAASRIVAKVSLAIARKARNYIRIPTDNDAIMMHHKFFEKNSFPRVLGCIDGTHVPIQAPSVANREIYRCRKGFMSLNVQGIADADMKFINIVARWPGSTHDSRILDNSMVCARFENDEFNGLLLGDSGYPCRSFLMTPFRNPHGHAETSYNTAQKRTRSVVERMFGVWKRRFPCLRTGVRVKLDTAMLIITATAVLHNIAVDLAEPDFDRDAPEPIDEELAIEGNDLLGNAVRQAIVQQYFQ